MSDPITDWLAVHSPAQDAVALIAKRAAAARLTELAARLPRFTAAKITDHTDWQRARTNVTHLVEPGLVRWEK